MPFINICKQCVNLDCKLPFLEAIYSYLRQFQYSEINNRTILKNKHKKYTKTEVQLNAK